MRTRTKLASAILAALLGGAYVWTAAPGHVTPEEQRAIDASGGDPLVRSLLEANDVARWTPAPVFAGAPRPTGVFELGGPRSLANFGYQSDHAEPAPAAISGRRVVFNDAPEPWGDRGPLWGVRAYNVVGEIHDLELWRCGDWTRGREGHAVYLNVAGSLLIDGLTGVQCGGQLLQLVWRVSETRMPRAEWPDAADQIELLNLRASDCGAINQGMSVRASWPVSIFATGARVSISSLEVRTCLPWFEGDRGERFRSHGALLLEWGEEGRRTPELRVVGLHGRVCSSDRPEVRLSAVDAAYLSAITMTEEGGDGACTISLIDDCGSLEVTDVRAPVRVELRSAARPWGMPVRTVDVPVGGSFAWRRP